MVFDSSLIKIFLPALASFLIGIGITPFITEFLYNNRMWKRSTRDVDNPDEMSSAYLDIHNKEEEGKTPHMGGTIIWMSVVAAAMLFWLLAWFLPTDATLHIEFISRQQTWLLFTALIAGSLIGLVDDISHIVKIPGLSVHGISRNLFLFIVLCISIVFALWFFYKLEMHTVLIPFIGDVSLGWGFIPFFIVVMMGMFTTGVIDGIDGLSGGVLALVYGAFGVIALVQGQGDIAAFCFAVAGGISAFLWFNVPPARFYMGEAILGLTLALTLVLFLTNRVLWIFIIGFPLVATSASSFIQIYSKRWFGKKIFRVAPLHHHFQALGWSKEKVVMRYWIFTAMASTLGIIIALLT